IEGRAGPRLLGAQPLGERRAAGVGGPPGACRRGALRQGAGQPLPARLALHSLPRRQGSAGVHVARGKATAAQGRSDLREPAGELGLFHAELREPRLERDLVLPHVGGEVSDLRHAVSHRLDREDGGIDRRDLVPAKRCRDPGIGSRAHRVRRRDRAVARVLAEVDEDAPAIGHAPRGRRDLLVADAALDLLRQRLREAADLREEQLRFDRRQDVEPRRARGLGVRGEAELVHHLAHDERDLPDIRPLSVRSRVEIDQQIVGPLDVLNAGVPGVQLDAAEVDDPREGSGVVDHGEHGRVSARELDVLLAHELRVGRHPLLVEEFSHHPVRVAHHVKGPTAEVRQDGVGEIDVVLRQVALRQAGLREEDLVGVADRNVDGAKYRRVRVAFVRRAPAILLVVLLSSLAAGCGGSSNKASNTTSTAAAASCAKGSLNLVHAGQLTVGTDNPAFPPWFGGAQKAPWKVSDPYSGQGYESAVAYAVATKLGFAKSEVKWIVVPFNTSFAPGPKKFDFDINQISYKPARANAVDFSDSYYDVNQALVVVKGTPIASATSIAALKPYKFGAQLGT